MIRPDLKSLFGIITDRGHMPAFFTDQTEASRFFAEHCEAGVFGQSNDIKNIRDNLSYNETSYVMLDGHVMTLRKMIETCTNQE